MVEMESLGGPSYAQYRSSDFSEPTSSGRGPSSSSSIAESTDTATTEAPGSEEEEFDVVPSLLDKLKAPKPSDLARKRKKRKRRVG